MLKTLDFVSDTKNAQFQTAHFKDGTSAVFAVSDFPDIENDVGDTRWLESVTKTAKGRDYDYLTYWGDRPGEEAVLAGFDEVTDGPEDDPWFPVFELRGGPDADTVRLVETALVEACGIAKAQGVMGKFEDDVFTIQRMNTFLNGMVEALRRISA